MAIDTTLTDTEGFEWDFRSVGPALGIDNGARDAFDGGLRLLVNGIGVNPAFASLDEGGRELNAQPVLIDGIAIQRSILVSDTAISTTGFARFLDSFTNTTDETVTITVSTRTNSGADDNLTFPATTSGDQTLTAADVGFTTSDGNSSRDSKVMIAYGDGNSAAGVPSSALVEADIITVNHTITLVPGETKSLLQFSTQSAATGAAEAAADLETFTGNAGALQAAGVLDGLSREEQLSIVNYSGFDTVQAPFTLIDGEGTAWTIDRQGRLSTRDTNAMTFQILGIFQNFDNLRDVEIDEYNREVVISNDGIEPNPNAVADYTYRALEDQGVIRLLVTLDITTGFGLFLPYSTGFSLGAADAPLVAQHFQSGGPTNGLVSGVVVDDSLSGSGGTLPAVTGVFGTVSTADTVSLSGSTLNVDSGLVFVGAGTKASFLYYFSVNQTGGAALADLERLATPGFEELAGLSDADLAQIRNFTLTSADRLDERTGSDILDDVFAGNVWGDQYSGLGGDDTISGGGSDDVLSGGNGDDTLDGGADDDILNGGNDDDVAIGGEGNDTINGDAGNDRLMGGNGTDTLNGGTDNDSLNGGLGADALNGGTGNDTYVLGADLSDTITDTAGIDTITSTVTRSMVGTATIERLVLKGTGDIDGTGNDLNNELFGTTGVNTLTGGIGNDVLNGGMGIDTLIGGTGNDTYVLGADADLITDTSGIDTITTTVTRSLASFAKIENLILNTGALNGTGNGLNNRITGNAAANTLNGGAGNDTLDGGEGLDTLIGGTGDDTYVLGAGTDTITDTSGLDTITSTITRSLAATPTIERLILQGDGNINATGNTLDNALFGTTGINTLTGGTGNDTLNGGLGADTLVGGTGNDTYVLGAENDTIVDTSGSDTITTTVTRSIEAYATIENLTLLTGALNGAGNSLNNTILGNAAVNVLSGGGGNDTLDGGSGTDTLVGETGNDTYVLGAENDTIIDSSGIDTITTTVTRSIAAYTTIENLTLLTGAVNGTGNSLDNTILGNAAANVLNGGTGNDTLNGGLSADTLIGGTGNDTYVLGAESDTVTDTSGIDTITTTVTRSIAAYTTIENLTLLTGALNGTGNSLDNTILGNTAANVLSGGTGNDTLNGALGNDRLTGGAGSDSFVFNSGLNAAANVDTITDFSVVSDTIRLDNAFFTAVGSNGTLSAAAFARNATGLAGDGSDRIIYETDTGKLFYDSNGSAAGGSTHFATVSINLLLTQNDFLII